MQAQIHEWAIPRSSKFLEQGTEGRTREQLSSFLVDELPQIWKSAFVKTAPENPDAIFRRVKSEESSNRINPEIWR